MSDLSKLAERLEAAHNRYVAGPIPHQPQSASREEWLNDGCIALGKLLLEAASVLRAQAIPCPDPDISALVERLDAIAALEDVLRGVSVRETCREAARALSSLAEDAGRLDWFEKQADTGAAPSLVYDDNGMWAIAEEGTQNVRTQDADDLVITHFVEAAKFKPTVREAIDDAALSAGDEREGG